MQYWCGVGLVRLSGPHPRPRVTAEGVAREAAGSCSAWSGTLPVARSKPMT
jgi:hypothetical protein